MSSERGDILNTGPMFKPPEGFPFRPDSPIRRFTEPAVFMLYPFIAGMTIMNDQIAAAVDRHSEFVEHPWGRLFGTVNSAITLVYGNEQESLDMAKKLWQFHSTVRGSHESVGYDANNANLQTWVLASVFKGLENAHLRWTTPLSSDERETLWQDVRTFGEVFGINPDLLPPDVDAFDAYWNKALESDYLLQNDISYKMAHKVFRFSSPKVPKPIAKIGQAITIASLDTRLQERAGLRPTKLDTRIASMTDFVMQNTYARIPHHMRERAIPAYLGIQRRLTPRLGRLAANNHGIRA